jgi:hypothetical protein
MPYSIIGAICDMKYKTRRLADSLMEINGYLVIPFCGLTLNIGCN